MTSFLMTNDHHSVFASYAHAFDMQTEYHGIYILNILPIDDDIQNNDI